MRRQDKLKMIAEANQRLERNYLKNKGLLNEALNKKLSDFQIDLKKRLEGLGFKIASYENQAPPQQVLATINDSDEKRAILQYNEYSGNEILTLQVNEKNKGFLEKIRNYYNIKDGEYAPGKNVGWYTKYVKNLNPGDITSSRIGDDGLVTFFRVSEKGEKTKSVQN